MAYNYPPQYGMQAQPQPYRYPPPNAYQYPQPQRPPQSVPGYAQPRTYVPPAQPYPPQGPPQAHPAPGYQPQSRMPQPYASLPASHPSPPPTRSQPSPQPPGRKESSTSNSGLGNRKGSVSDVKVPIHKLRSLSKEELESIESDEGKFLEFFTEIKPDLVDLKRVEEDREKLQEQNRSAAEKTLEKEPSLQAAVQKMVLLTTEARALKEQYDEKTRKLVNRVSKFETPELKRDLEKGAKTAEDEAEALMEEFIAGAVTCADFMERFLQLRTTYWLRKVKTEKLDELQKSRPPSAGKSGSGPQGSAPYPLASRMPVPRGY